MHTRIACRISVIKRIDLRMWLPIESMARNWTTYIRPGNNRGPISRWKCPKQKTAPRTEINVKIALIYYFFFPNCNFPSIFESRKKWLLYFFDIKRNSHAALLNIQKLNYSKIALCCGALCLTIYAIDFLGSQLGLGLGLGLGWGFRFGLQAYSSQKFFFFVCK